MNTRETLQTFARAYRYIAPFSRAMLIKLLLTLLGLLLLLLMPWPMKILVDHVVLGTPIDGQSYPAMIRPLLLPLAGLSPQQLLIAVLLAQATLVLAIGAMGVAGRDRSRLEAPFGIGYDTATRTENMANQGFSMVGGLLGLLDFRFTLRLSHRINHHYRSRLFERILAMPLGRFDDARIGDAIYVVMYDTPSITDAVYRIILTPILVPIMALAIAYALPGAGHGLAPLALLMLPGVLLFTYPFAKRFRQKSAESRQAGANATARIEESVGNILAVQSQGGTQREEDRFLKESWASFSRYRAQLLVAFSAFMMAALPGALIISFATIKIAQLIIEGQLTAGDFSVLFTYAGAYFLLAAELGAIWIRIQDASVGMSRVFALMDQPIEADAEGALELKPLESTLRFEHVSFSYHEKQTLFDINLEAKRGQLVGLVGPAGAGKSTLVSLLPRFLEPSAGRITIDGVDIAKVKRASLRAQIAFVFQECILFDDSVSENIRCGANVTEDEVHRAARLAQAHDFITALPEGYASQLGRGGMKLSLGQRHRLAIARALVRDTPILVLDEPTAALDPQTERALMKALKSCAKTKLILVITHKQSTIKDADQRLHLEGGRLIEAS